MTIKLAELIADRFAAHLDVSRMTQLEHDILHAIKNVAMAQFAREYLKAHKGVN